MSVGGSPRELVRNHPVITSQKEQHTRMYHPVRHTVIKISDWMIVADHRMSSCHLVIDRTGRETIKTQTPDGKKSNTDSAGKSKTQTGGTTRTGKSETRRDDPDWKKQNLDWRGEPDWKK